MKKIISLALVLALMLTMSVCAFAADMELYVGQKGTYEYECNTAGLLFVPTPKVTARDNNGEVKVDVAAGKPEMTSYYFIGASWKTPIEVMGSKAGTASVLVYDRTNNKHVVFTVLIKEFPIYRENYIADLTGGRVLNITNIGEMFGQKNLNAATVGPNNTLQNLYDDRGNLIVNVTLSTDGHVYFVPTETGMITMEAARGPQFASQEEANCAYEAAVKAYLAKAAAQNEAYIAAVKAANK